MIRKRKTTNGKLRYQAIAHKDGGKTTLGTFPTQTEAKDAIRAFENTPATDPRLVSEWAQTWFELYPRPSHTTTRHNRQQIKAFLEVFGTRQLSSIGRAEAKAWAIKHPGNTRVVRAMFNDACDAEVVDRNPFSKLNLPQGRGRKDLVPLTEDEVQRLADCSLVALDAFYGPVFRAAVLFHAYVGLRTGEFCGLEWDDLAGDTLHVQRQVRNDGSVSLPKQDRKRTIIIPEVARDALRSVPAKHRWIFSSPMGKRLTPDSYRTAFTTVRHAAGLHDLVPYALRHFCGSLLADRGLTARDISSQLGNSPEVCEAVYIHSYEDRTRDRLRLAFSIGGEVDAREAAG